jgi:hypothetical protein
MVEIWCWYCCYFGWDCQRSGFGDSQRNREMFGYLREQLYVVIVRGMIRRLVGVYSEGGKWNGLSCRQACARSFHRLADLSL